MAAYELDRTDRLILNSLMEDAKTTYTKIAQMIPVSDGTVHVRMKKMEQLGVVTGSRLIVDYSALGYDLTAYIGIYLEKGSVYKDVIAQLEKVPEIVEAHYITGAYSIFCKLICQNTEHLRTILNDQVQAIDGVRRTETFISLENSIHRSLKLPV
ncbi:MAG: Lrp/AsnC ligand binding domain-containing protein [Sphingobacteriaceae bacterium]|jgi:Lrp/AsnC family transcriptional regulator, regulator for asnA, asnC and gidA|nr:Lrp/AsnC ligand binding domain-containing protein [Sphingobacteriaceae bacterium]